MIQILFETYIDQEGMTSQNCSLTLEHEEGLELDLPLELNPEPALPTPTARQLRPSPEQTSTSLNNGCISVFSHIGKRSSNLDRFDWFVCETYQLYAVYDGHVTAAVSNYLKQHLLPTLVSALSVGNDFAQAALLSFNLIEQQVLALQNSTEEFLGGSTAIVCMVVGETVFTANLGDCRAVLVSSQGDLQSLSRAHTLNDPVENQEVCDRGGLVVRCGNSLRLNGELCLSRSIGDAKYKAFLSATPEISVYRNTDSKYLVLGSDGFWGEAKEISLSKIARCDCTVDTSRELFESARTRPRDNSTVLCIRLIQ